jgi:hypothetical protein
MDCIETRKIKSSDYNANEKVVEKIVTRKLQQAMVPGAHLVKVEMAKTVYDARMS